ncbi:uncharacterized protein LAESUDRAFT_754633 [Laetiporus sulphureus 93-53]|uniref:L domain-like protein n=1 Tax=Laetiporus sulphureus 93-53 TaxID=1314785 RepID=A0A165HSK7_9APHY|nr:uncharacterized protein LAESUDRAFT_754633 [Laetiporus sulphureus 93-53]KZT12130.1 hypothetical protein LAESUDRAFT_754633 [Laetiporus sulphureus 93-53]
MFARPAWQTDELADEWVNQDDEPSSRGQSSSDLSLTQPLESVIVQHGDLNYGSIHVRGTFLVKDDVPATPFLQRMPGRQQPSSNNLFSPHPLERMFESPPTTSHDRTASPPPRAIVPGVAVTLSKACMPTQDDIVAIRAEDEVQRDLANPYAMRGIPGSTDFPFTFEAQLPRSSAGAGDQDGAHRDSVLPHISTTGTAPTHMDPPLRLFQFNYDTYTRDHLSAIVDSIAVNTPSGGSDTANYGDTTSPSASSLAPDSSPLCLRSAKRIKLSSSTGFQSRGDRAALILRPPLQRRKFKGEPRLLMATAKKATPMSTMATIGTTRSSASRSTLTPHIRRSAFRSSPLRHPPVTFAEAPSKGIFPAVDYRAQAADLMAQIRNDIKRPRRPSMDDSSLRVQVDGDSDSSLKVPSGRTSLFANAPSNTECVNEANVQPLCTHGLARSSNATDPGNRALTERIFKLSLDPRKLDQFSGPSAGVAVIIADATPPTAENSHGHEHNPTLLAPPGIAAVQSSPFTRSGKIQDLTRFVSSSTASGTTLTTGSTGSFVKHPGPKQITRITPEDVPTLPDRVGRMVFDKASMRWVKAATDTPGGGDLDNANGKSEYESEDPFHDIESIRDERESSRRSHESATSLGRQQRRYDERTREELDAHDDGAGLTLFVFDIPATDVIPHNNRKYPEDMSAITDSEDDLDDGLGDAGHSAAIEDSSDDSFDGGQRLEEHATIPASQTSPPEPLIPPQSSVPRQAASPFLTPAARQPTKSSSVAPASALKDPQKFCTPALQQAPRRSVSFSDGKRDGPIIGLGRNAPAPDGPGAEAEDGSPLAAGTSRRSSVLVPSARSKRIAEMLGDLGEPEESPLRTSNSARPVVDERQQHTAPDPSGNEIEIATGTPNSDIPRRVFSRPQPVQSASTSAAAHRTFLTECSFGVAHDRLVQVITDVQPFEPHWENLTSIDLSRVNLDSVARLKEFLPRLDSLSLNSNHLSWLSGIPDTVRSLSVASNLLTSLTSFGHLPNLSHLDISHNQIDSLRQLECLRHLRELRADGNRIVDIDGLQQMDGLAKLSLQDNAIRSIDLRQYRWTRLEMLNLSHNRLASVVGLASLSALVALNLDNNLLEELDPDGPLTRLRLLRMSGNRLTQLNASAFLHLRTLYADNNALGAISHLGRLTRLESLSVRNQGGRTGLTLSIREIRDVKRLYLSGNALKPGFISEPCYNLLYLELAACRLTALPSDLARVIPNVRVLNLNYNFLEDVRPLAGLLRLRKLTIIGSRLKSARQLVKALKGMTDIEMLDFRMNPCTLGWYLPLLIRDVPGALQPSDAAGGGPASREDGAWTHARPSRNGHKARDSSPSASPSRGASVSVPTPGASASVWKDLDAKFRRDLPDEAYVGRLAYRGLVMRACPAIRVLDGVEISRKEREKAEQVLKGAVGMARRPGEGAGGGGRAGGGEGGISSIGEREAAFHAF